MKSTFSCLGCTIIGILILFGTGAVLFEVLGACQCDIQTLPNKFQAWTISFRVPEVQQREQVVLDAIDHAAQMPFLQEITTDPLSADDIYIGCIKGSVTRTYGTDLIFRYCNSEFQCSFQYF